MALLASLEGSPFEALGWYLSIFFWLFFTGLGIPPCPEEVGILYAASLAAIHPQVHWWLAWPAAGAGIVCADMELYGAGRLWGDRLLALRWVRWLLSRDEQQQLKKRFEKRGLGIVFLARVLPPLRTGVFLIAGTVPLPFLRVLGADLLYGVVGVGILFFGGAWLIGLVHKANTWLTYATIGVVAGYILYRLYRSWRKRKK